MNYSLREEIANAVSHGIGTLMSIAGLVLLIVFASIEGTVWHVVSFTIFGVTLVLLYLFSTLLHSFKEGTRVKDVFEIFDHSGIYLLIAGTYTPFMLVSLRGPLGWSLFGVIWGLAFAGIVFKIFFVKRFNFVSTLLYIAMGWIIIFAFGPLTKSLDPLGIFWLVMGGVAYTVGTIFYLWRAFKYHHMVWHLFVIAGSVCHFFAILLYV